MPELPFALPAPIIDGLIALAIALVINLTVLLGKRVAHRTLSERAIRTAGVWDDVTLMVVSRVRQWLVFPVSLYVASHYLTLPAVAMTALKAVAVLCLFIQAGLLVSAFLEFYIDRARARAAATNVGATTGMAALAFIGRVAIWSIMLLLALTNLGVDVTAFVAGLGVGGVAVALAVQNILGDLFASLSIVLDKPFEVGDFIIVDDYLGTVEQVGLKTTRIRSLWGEQLIMSNGDLLKSRVRNYKRMRERRVVWSFGVEYKTSADQLERIPKMIRAIVDGVEKARFDRAHLMKFGDSGLEFEVVYYVLDPDFNLHMDIQQQIQLGLIRGLEKERISFAFPTRTITFDATTRLDLANASCRVEQRTSGQSERIGVEPHGSTLKADDHAARTA